jgi:hypothetical protein
MRLTDRKFSRGKNVLKVEEKKMEIDERVTAKIIDSLKKNLPRR